MVDFKPVKMNDAQFEQFYNEMQNLDADHELEIIEVESGPILALEGKKEKEYTLHVKEKPWFFFRILRNLFYTPGNVRISNVGQFLLSLYKENLENIYNLSESKAENFALKTQHYFHDYDAIMEKTIAVAVGLIVHQQHANEEYKELQKTNIELFTRADTAEKKLIGYEKMQGTLQEIEKKIAVLDEKRKEAEALEAKVEELTGKKGTLEEEITQLSSEKEEVEKAVGELKDKLQVATQAVEEANKEAKSIHSKVEEAKVWAKEVELSHARLQTKAQEIVKEYVDQYEQQAKDHYDQQARGVLEQAAKQAVEYTEKHISEANESIAQKHKQAEIEIAAMKKQSNQEIKSDKEKARKELDEMKAEIEKMRKEKADWEQLKKEEEEKKNFQVDDIGFGY